MASQKNVNRYFSSVPKASEPTGRSRKKILPYGGVLDGMSKKDYADFVRRTKKTRTKLFDRANI